MDYFQKSLELHALWKGKLSIKPKAAVNTSEDLALAYTPGVAAPCKEIHKNPELVYTYTGRGNTVAVVSDGSAVLGLGNIGALAGLPVMEGKALLFKEFADIDSFPIILDTQDVDEIVETVRHIAPSFGGINLEDISAPRCFLVEKKLKELLDIPVFHDDQHGTAIVVLAAVINSLKITGKDIKDIKIAINGPGAAGTAIAKLLLFYGAKDIIMNDKDGIIYKGKEGLDFAKTELACLTNKEGIKGGLNEAVKGADIFIGVSAPDCLTPGMIKTMNCKPVIFAMANPQPEIEPQKALDAGAVIVGTGRSDYPNQINNVLVFPGMFRGALDARASAISEEMKIAAANAIAQLVKPSELRTDYILPKALDKRVAAAVAKAVSETAARQGLSKLK